MQKLTSLGNSPLRDRTAALQLQIRHC